MTPPSKTNDATDLETPEELTPQEALRELRRRGASLDEEEREYLLRRALQAVHAETLADRLLEAVPELTSARTPAECVETPAECVEADDDDISELDDEPDHRPN